MKKSMNFNHARQNLLDLKNAMDRVGIPFFLTAGVLLGAVRDKDFIGNDNDIDVGIFIEDFKEDKFINELEAAGFKIVLKKGDYNKNLQYVAKKEHIETDFYFFYRKKKYMYYTAHFFRTGPVVFRYKVQNLKEYRFLDTEFLVPESPEYYLEEHYGKKWRIPNKKWTWPLSCNIHKANLKNRLKIMRQWIKYYLKLL